MFRKRAGGERAQRKRPAEDEVEEEDPSTSNREDNDER